jgi:hypothetical protein
MNRFSSTFHKFFYGMKIFQYTYQLLDLNISTMIQSLLLIHLNDLQKIPPIGYAYSSAITLPQLTPSTGETSAPSPPSSSGAGGDPAAMTMNNPAYGAANSSSPSAPPAATENNKVSTNSLIYSIGKWFIQVIHAIHNRPATNSPSGNQQQSINHLLWVPYRNIFMNFNKNKNTAANSSAKHDHINPNSPNFAIELYLNHDELVYLLSFIGMNGYKVIEGLLMNLIQEQVIKQFLLRHFLIHSFLFHF